MKRLLITEPAVWPLNRRELREQVRVESAEFDTYLDELGREATETAEAYTWRKLCTQTWEYYLDAFPDRVRLPFPPAASITHVKYTDTSGTLQTVADTVYELGEDHGVGIVRLKYSQTWPVDCRGHEDDVVIQFVCGYGASEDVPRPIKRALALYVAFMFRNREEGAPPDAFYRTLSLFISPDKLRMVYLGV